MGIAPLAQAKSQISENLEPGTLASTTQDESRSPGTKSENEADELVEKDMRMRFKRMCENYFEDVAKILLIAHKVGFIFCTTVH